MAEIENRMELEEEFYLRMLSLWEQQRANLRDLISFPPSIEFVTNDFWAESESENYEELLYWLAFIFFRSAMQHGELLGVDEQQARVQAEMYARQRAFTSSTSITRHSQKLLLRAGEDWREGKNQTQAYLNERLEMIFGDSRLSRVSATETTDPSSAGAEWALEITGNISGDDTWYTAADERVCPYCGPLHRQPRSMWQRIYETQILPVFPQGSAYGDPRRTPAHVECRCFILYNVGAGNVSTTSI
jgi:hypothetical protein